MATVRKYQRVCPTTRAYIKLAKGIRSVEDLIDKTNVSKAHIHRIWNEDLTPKKTALKSPGRPKKLDARMERRLIRLIPKMRSVDKNWTVRRLMQMAEVDHVHRFTVTRALNRNGFWYLQCRKKGLLSLKDKKLRVQFAKEMLKRPDSATYWINGISFYLDGVGFVYKRYPKDQAAAPSGRCWRRTGEGQIETTKGKACGTGGNYVKVIVCISHGRGVVCALPYDHMNGETFANFVTNNFKELFDKCNKPIVNGNKSVHVWLQDGDKSQNSAEAKVAMQAMEANVVQSIPARSPDLNPIENMFHIVKAHLTQQAIQQNIEVETKDEFQQRVLSTLQNFSPHIINKTIESMEKRLRLIVACKGNRLKY